ncbi:hypothetical protein [Hymenobacter gummosus]|nr:hypothetical protein [Hymenobacter gummosus]
MLAVNLYGCVVLGAAGLGNGWSLLVGGAALFIGWRLYRVD